MAGETRDHYDRLARRYDENWVHGGEFISWMTGCILDRLDLRPGDRVADVGCGTGLFSRGLAEQAGQVLCVDPSPGMLAQLSNDERLFPVGASAEGIASGVVKLPTDRLDAILVKEAIHHVTDPTGTLAGLARLLAPSGRLLVVMLPTRIDYPLFDAALRAFEEHQPDPVDIRDDLERAGLQAHLTYESFPLSFSKDRYLSMVRNRYMSLLSMFDDAQLEEGIAEIERHHPEEVLEFPDRFAFVLGRRP